jgi:hypothetical protein
MRVPAWENGGFITMTCGAGSFQAESFGGRIFASCSASSRVMWLAWVMARSAARRVSISFAITFPPRSDAQEASPPVPADGSRTTSPGWIPAAHTTAPA